MSQAFQSFQGIIVVADIVLPVLQYHSCQAAASDTGSGSSAVHAVNGPVQLHVLAMYNMLQLHELATYFCSVHAQWKGALAWQTCSQWRQHDLQASTAKVMAST